MDPPTPPTRHPPAPHHPLASHFTPLLPLCHPDKQAATSKATKASKDHDNALANAKNEAATWKAKHDHLRCTMGLELQLKEAQVKNSMMAVAWSAHTSALTMRFPPGAMGGLAAGSPIPDGTPPPPTNPFSAFV